MPQVKTTKRKLSESDVSSSENNDQSDDEEFFPAKSSKGAVKTPKRAAVKKSKILSNACDSDDETLVKGLQKKSLQNNNVQDDGKFMHQTAGKPPKKAIKKKRVKKSKAMLTTDANDSDEEPLVKMLQKKSPVMKSVQNKSSKEDKYEPLDKVNGFSKKNGHEQENDSMSCSSVETEHLLLKRLKFKEKNERSSVSSDEDEPITTIVQPKIEERSANERIASSSSEDEPMVVKSKMDASSSLNRSSKRSSISTVKEDSDEGDVSMTVLSEEDAHKAETISEQTSKSKVFSSQKKRKRRKHIQSEEIRYGESINEEEPTSKTAETSRSKKFPKDNSGKIKRSRRNCATSEQEIVKLAIKSLKEIIKPSLEFNTEDEFSVAGKKYVCELKMLNKDQRIVAEKLISDTIYYAKLNKLNEYSTVELNTPQLQQRPRDYSRNTGDTYNLNEPSTVRPCTLQPQQKNQHLTSESQPFTSPNFCSQPSELLLTSEDIGR